MSRTVDKLLRNTKRESLTPRVGSFAQFLTEHARVKQTDGSYGPYTFEGREALREVVDTVDTILGSQTGEPLKDSTLVLAGGAQFGKTILELNLAGYITACRWMNIGVYLPDDKLSAEIVKTKFRPDVLDQIDWLASLITTVAARNKSGRSVHTDRVFAATDGTHYSVGLFHGLQKVPTTFMQDVVVRDEEDDIPRDKAKFLSGRLTASALRLQIIVGTQRIHGAGQNRQWENGSQGVIELPVADAPRSTTEREGVPLHINPEDHWPQICRLAVDGAPKPTDPKLTWEGEFKDATGKTWHYDPAAHYYLAHPVTNEPLDRHRPRWTHRRPERIKLRRWSYRISQLGCAAIDLAQIVAHWTRAVADSGEMISFCCDRLAKPKSAAQALTPAILERARAVAPFDFGGERRAVRTEAVHFGGLDMGDRCWLYVRESDPDRGVKRCLACYTIAAGDVVNRVRALAFTYGIGVLLVDQRPLVNEARTIALALNGLTSLEHWPRIPDEKTAFITLPGGLTWDGPRQQWRGLKAAVVRFDKKQLGAGIVQTLDVFEEGGQTKFVPCIQCNRFETIDRAVREFLTPAENVMEVVTARDEHGKEIRRVRETPAMLLPRRVPGSPAILETLDAHLLAGSQREKDEKTGELGDYVDAIENHLLLADAYSGLAELVGSTRSTRGFRGVHGFHYGPARADRETRTIVDGQ